MKGIGKILIKAAVIITTLAILLASIVWLIPLLRIKDGKIQIPEYNTPTTQTTVPMEEDTDDLTFKCTFNWEEKDGTRIDYESSTCYLWIQRTEDGPQAKFTYGEYLIDGWPVYPVSHTGNQYILESSARSFVERVRIVLNVEDEKISGTVKNITPDISTFVEGSFTGEPISFEQYAAEVLQ